MALIVTVDNQDYKVEFEEIGADFRLKVNGVYSTVSLVGQKNNEIMCVIDNKPYTVELISPDQIKVNGDTYEVSVIDERVKSVIKSAGFESHRKELVIKTPMPGLTIDVLVKIGDQVEAGQGLIIIEAMKMQNEIKSSRKGKIKNIMVNKGQTVNSGDAITVIE